MGKPYSTKVDSMTREHINMLSSDKRNKFNKVIEQRLAVNLFERIDTTNFDYVFDEENYCQDDTVAIISERCFFEEDRKKVDYIQKDKIIHGDVLHFK